MSNRSETILKKNGIKAKQLELLKSNCTALLPEDILDNVLELAGLSKLEMNLMLGNVPLEYEDSYWDNISAIAQLLTAKEAVKDNKKANVEFRTSQGELYHADCLDVLLYTATFRGRQGRVLRPDRAILSGQF